MITNPLAPFTGFGDDYNTSIKFQIEYPSRGFPHWAGGPKLSQHTIANSDRVVTQYHGRTPWRISLTLWLATIDELEALDGLQGRRHTLRYLWGLSKRVGGAKETILSIDYLTLPGTLLVALTDEVIAVDGVCEVTATFERSYDPAGDRYGLAHYS